MKYRLSDRSPEFQQRWNRVFDQDWGLWNLATFLGSGKGVTKPIERRAKKVLEETPVTELESQIREKVPEGASKKIMECIEEKRKKRGRPKGNGGNGKVKKSKVYTMPTVKPPTMLSGPMPVNDVPKPSPIEQAFTELKKSKMERLKELLLSFTVAELLEAEKSMGVKDLFENVTALAQELANGKKVA